MHFLKSSAAMSAARVQRLKPWIALASGWALLGVVWLYSYREAWFLDRGSVRLIAGSLDAADEAQGSKKGQVDGWYALRKTCREANYPDASVGIAGGQLMQWCGFEFGNAALLGERPFYVIAFPLWAVGVAISVPVSAIALQRWQQLKRLRGGCCVACGYDLRASSDRCPECGSAEASVP